MFQWVFGVFQRRRQKLGEKVAFAASENLENNDFYDHKHVEIQEKKSLREKNFLHFFQTPESVLTRKIPVKTIENRILWVPESFRGLISAPSRRF